jgi:phage-related protein
MSEDIGSLVVRIEANLSNFNSNITSAADKIGGFDSKVESMASKVSDGFKKIVTAAAALGAVKAVGDFLKSSIEDAAEAEANLTQLETVIKSTGGAAGVTAESVTNMAASLQKVTKFSDDAIIAGDNMLLTFTNIGKDVFPQATETMLDMAQSLGMDATSAAIQLGKALNDPTDGVSKLTRVGVTFTDEQKNLIKSLQETGDVAGAQKVMLQELQREFGGSAKAAGTTFAGKLEILKNAFGEVKESIGGALMPVLTNLMTWFSGKMPAIQDFATNAFNKISDVISPIANALVPLLQEGFNYFTTTILPPLQAAFQNFTSSVLPPLQAAFQSYIDNIMPVLQKAFEAFTTTVLPALQSAFDNITQNVLPPLFTAFQYYVDNVAPIVAEAFNYLIDKVLPPLIEIFNYITNEVIPMLAAKFQEWMPKIVKIVQGLWDGIKPIIDFIVAAFEFAWPQIKNAVSNAIEMISGVIDGLLKVLQGVIDFIAGVFTGDWDRAWNGILEIFEGIGDAIASVFKGLINQVINGLNFLIQKLNGINIDMPDWVEEMFNIGSIGFSIPEIPKLNVGTNFVPFDTAAFIHKGEAVIPAENNPSNPNASNPIGSINYANMFNGATFIVRNDDDAKLIAREIFELNQTGYRAVGVET